MNKKNIITVSIVSIMIVVSFILGTVSVKRRMEKEVQVITETKEAAIPDNYIDVSEISDYEKSTDGLQLNFKDGTGYYIEGIQNKNESDIQIHYNTTQESEHRLVEALENREGKIIIEVVIGTVEDNKGNGHDTLGYYYKYDNKRFHKGDKVRTILIYNPENNFIDDILYRYDIKVN